MKAVRLTTAFAVVWGTVLPIPVVTDLVPATWAAEKGDPPAGDGLRQRAEDLAKSASDQFGKIVGGKDEQSRAHRTIDVSERSGSSIGLVEQVHGWTSRSAAEYQTLMRGLSQPLTLNPVADAATRQAAGRDRSLKGGSDAQRDHRPEARTLIESAVGWIHRAGREYQTVVRGLSAPGSDAMTIAGKTPAIVTPDKTPTDVKSSEQTGDRQIAEAKQAESASQAEARRAADAREAEARRADQSRRAAEEKRAEDARKVAEARQADEARRVEEARRALEAKQAADAREAAEARRVAQARAADDARKAEEVRIAAAAKQAEDARRVAEAQKAADARRAEEMRVAAAKQAEGAQRAEDARRVAEVQKVAEAKRAEETRIAAAKQVEDARRAEAARRVAEAQAREASPATVAPSRKGAGDNRKVSQKRAERKERTARKGGPSRKVAVASSRKRAKQGLSPGAGKGRRWKKTHPEHVCRMVGARTSVPGWYIVRRGDTLWKIAARHYGAGRRFPVIYRANTRRIADPNRLVRCQRLYLPKFRRRG